MNKKILEKTKRRCKLGIRNPKKDVYARRRAGYSCVGGVLSLLGAREKAIVSATVIEPKLKWYQRIWLWIKSLFAAVRR